jgi:FkbM family methyltransferase
MITNLRNLMAGFTSLRVFDNWLQVLVNRLLFRHEALVIYRLGRLRLLVDHDGGDQNGTRACLSGDMYGRYFDCLPKVSPLCVLDLGANGGGLPLALWHHGFELNALVCVEMNPATFSRLQFNVHANAPSRTATHLFNAAAFSSDGEISVSLGHGSTGDNLFGSCHGLQLTIPTLTFDTLVERSLGDAQIDLCKIDIESAEHELLLDGPTRRLSQVRLLLIEIHPRAGRTTVALIERILLLGFRELRTHQETDGECSVHLFERVNTSSPTT